MLYWRKKNGEMVLISAMSDQHLLNAIRMLKRGLPHQYLQALRLERRRRKAQRDKIEAPTCSHSRSHWCEGCCP